MLVGSFSFSPPPLSCLLPTTPEVEERKKKKILFMRQSPSRPSKEHTKKIETFSRTKQRSKHLVLWLYNTVQVNNSNKKDTQRNAIFIVPLYLYIPIYILAIFLIVEPHSSFSFYLPFCTQFLLTQTSTEYLLEEFTCCCCYCCWWWYMGWMVGKYLPQFCVLRNYDLILVKGKINRTVAKVGGGSSLTYDIICTLSRYFSKDWVNNHLLVINKLE